jgi:hypothetical protein
MSVTDKNMIVERQHFNLNETAIPTNWKPTKHLGPKGQKHVGAVTSLKQQKNVIVFCSNLEKISLLELFIVALKTGRLMKNRFFCGPTISMLA